MLTMKNEGPELDAVFTASCFWGNLCWGALKQGAAGHVTLLVAGFKENNSTGLSTPKSTLFTGIPLRTTVPILQVCIVLAAGGHSRCQGVCLGRT